MPRLPDLSASRLMMPGWTAPGRSVMGARLLVTTLTVGLAVASHGLVVAEDHKGEYRVQPGDTLSSISRATGMAVDALVAINGLTDPDVLFAGQVLKLSEPAARDAPSVTYAVQPGDTLYSIAQRGGVSVDTLMAVNGLGDPDVLLVGQQLVVPTDWTTSPGLRGDVVAAGQPTARVGPAPSARPVAAQRPTPVPSGTPSASPSPLRPRPPPRSAEVGTWVGSPNYWEGRPAGPPVAIVLHTAAGTLAGMDTWFASADSQSSAHFGIGLGGAIHQYVKLEDRSWCNGALEPGNLWPVSQSIQPNELTVNIETEDRGQIHETVTDAQYEATVRVGRAILARYPQIRYLMTHRALNPRTRADDPGPRWLESGRFAALAQELKLIPIP